MRKMNTLMSAMLCLCTMCTLALPAHALEYNISAPGSPEYGKPTSFEPAVTADGGAMKNEDLSKSAALIPPTFGSPTSYLPGSGEYLTPDLVSSQMAGAGTVNGNAETFLPPSLGTVSGSAAASPTPAAGFTGVTGGMYYSDGSLGTLKIPSIGLTVKVFEGTDTAALAKGAGHFEGASIWNGNVSVAGHNRGAHACFGGIHTLKSGDIITLTTKLGTRAYAVSSVAKIPETDVSGLTPTSGNQLTLYTCVADQPTFRWCVIAVETV